MKKILKKSISILLVAIMIMQISPLFNGNVVFAAQTLINELPEKIEIDVDEYIKLSVSKENGGFLIDTGIGDNLEAEDDNKFLLYPDEYYDTSYTSFKITKENGSVNEYIFGREYGFFGLSSEMISTEIENGNTVVSKWRLDDLIFTQELTVLNEADVSHGMVEISYDVENTGSTNYSSIETRILLDTALGYQDYGYYELPSGEMGSGEKYTTVESEMVFDNTNEEAYKNMFFVYDDLVNPKVRAYTVNANVGDTTIIPTKVAFGHWQNFSAQIFDFVPQKDLYFTNPYNLENMTADSAYALYFDMGALSAGESSQIATNYGIFSNSNEIGNNDVIINFSSTPPPLVLDKSGEKPVYENGGEFEVSFQLQNQSSEDISDMWLDIRLQSGVYVRDGEEYSDRIEVGKVNSLGNATYTLNLYADAENEISDYRSIVVQAYSGETPISSAKEVFVFCPGIGTDGVVVNALTPEIVYHEMERDIFLSMAGTGAVKNKGDYDLKLINKSSGDEFIVAPDNITVFTGDNSVQIHLDEKMSVGEWEILFDFHDESAKDVSSGNLTFRVTDDPKFMPNTYGLITIERDGTVDADRTNYSLKVYKDQEEYERLNTDPNNLTLLEFKGLFTVKEGTKEAPIEIVGTSNVLPGDVVQNTMVISNSLDVEDGMIQITQDSGTINVDIDAKVYTTGARTVVWDGVCAITSFEDGQDMELLQYNYDGEIVGGNVGEVENSVANTNAITLLWPGAASTAQTIGGVLMELRYGQFGQMATERGTVDTETPKIPIIAFGAQLSPDLLVPSSYWSSGAEADRLSAMEQQQMEIVNNSANPYYEANKLRDIQDKYASAQKNHESWSNAELGLYVHDILFSGGFIGFNVSVEVGIPAYVDGMPSLQGQLNLKVINNEWEFGVQGSADLAILTMEGSLRLKSYNGIPVPDEVYFFIGGFVPGINVEGFGIFWIQGAGGGFKDLYSTIFPTSKIPPLTLMITGQFGLFGVLSTKADVAVSLRGIDASLSDMSVYGVTVIDKMGLSVHWYPEIRLYAGVEIDLLGAVLGSGYLVLEENQLDNSWFWEGFARATVRVPDSIPVVGEMELGNVGIGMNVNRAWGSVSVLKVDLGISYEWDTTDINFAMGKYDVPEPTYDLASVINEAPTVQLMNLSSSIIPLSVPNSSGDRYIHQLPIPTENEQDILAELSFTANSQAEAEKIAKSITMSSGSVDRNLVWDESGNGTDENANAMLYTTEVGGTIEAKVILSFTESDDFDKTWEIGIDANSTLSSVTVDRLPQITSAVLNGNSITIDGDLDAMESINVYAKSGEQVYPIATDESPSGASTTLVLNPPKTLPTGDYELEVVAKTKDETSNPIIVADGIYSFDNPDQPTQPTLQTAVLGGDYTIDIPVTPNGEVDGYQATIYEVGDDGSKTPLEDFPRQNIAYDSEDNVLVVGGRHEVLTGETLESATTSFIGLETGKKYVVGIQSYKEVAATSDPENKIAVLSTEVLTNELTMITPQDTKVNLTIANAKQLQNDLMPSDGTTAYSYQTVSSSSITVSVSSEGGTVEKGSYSLDGGEIVNWSKGSTIRFNDLQPGMHTLYFSGENDTGDAVQETIAFNVDTVAPKLLVSSQNQGFFNNEVVGDSIVIEGFSEKTVTLYATVEGIQKAKKLVESDDGSFNITVPLDTTQAYQFVQLWAVDESDNESKKISIPLINSKLSTEELNYSIYLDDANVTNTQIKNVAGTFSLALTADNGEIISINDDSLVTSNKVEWLVVPKEGAASIENGVMTTDLGATGILSASLGGHIVSVGYKSDTPIIIEGAKQTITQGDELTVVSNAPHNEYNSTKIDDKAVESKFVDTKDGSTIVTVSGEFTATLTPGEHSISVVSSSGEAQTTFTVLERETDSTDDPSVPGTGDTSNYLLALIALVLSFISIVILKKKMNKAQR